LKAVEEECDSDIWFCYVPSQIDFQL